MPIINLDPDVKTQLQTWLTESEGINDWLAVNGPEHADYNWHKGQKDLYELLLAKDGQNLKPSELTPLMLDTAQEILDSYDNAVDLEYEIFSGGPKIKRSKMRSFIHDILGIGGR